MAQTVAPEEGDDAREFVVANPHERMIKKGRCCPLFVYGGHKHRIYFQGCRTGSSYPLSFRMRWKEQLQACLDDCEQAQLLVKSGLLWAGSSC